MQSAFLHYLLMFVKKLNKFKHTLILCLSLNITKLHNSRELYTYCHMNNFGNDIHVDLGI